MQINKSSTVAWAGTAHEIVSQPDCAVLGQYLNNSRVTEISSITTVPGVKSPDDTESSPPAPYALISSTNDSWNIPASSTQAIRGSTVLTHAAQGSLKSTSHS